MPTVYLAPGPFGAGGQFFGLGGLPLNLGTITTYAAGSTTPLATYTTSAGSVQNANPIVLGTDGRPPNEIWITGDSYRFDLKDSLGNLIKTYDDLSTASSSVNVTFQQAGTGAVIRTAQSKLREIISPDDFGCTGDGVTDDSANMILAGTAASGKTLKLTAGKTYILAAVDVPASSSGTVIDMTGASVKLKVLGTNVGSPIFNVTSTGRIKFLNGFVDGQKSSQPADGFSDSFNTGANGTGRAFRSAIKCDATIATGVTKVEVVGTYFKNTYGAPVATQDVPTVIVRDCYSETCNFELVYAYRSAGTLLNFQCIDNIMDTPASGDATVNANGCLAQNYRRVIVRGNICFNSERNLCKIEGGQNISITANVMDTNSVDNFTGIQVDARAATPVSRCVINDNLIYNCGGGIQVSVTSTTPDTITVNDNEIYTTTGTTLADAIRLGPATNVTVMGNIGTGIKRLGVYVSDTCARAKISGNQLYGQGAAGTEAILCTATTADFGSLSIENNHCENFSKTAVDQGLINLQRSAAFVFAVVVVKGNTVLAGASTNRGLYFPTDCVTAGVVSDNYIDGLFETASAGLLVKDNTITGTVTTPSALRSWTPSLLFGGGSTGLTYTTQQGRYRVIDGRVFFDLRIVLSAKGSSSGSATISGLPLTSGNFTGYVASCSLTASLLTFTGIPVANVNGNSSSVSLAVFATTGALSALADTAFVNTTDLRISGSYDIAGMTS